MEKALPGSSPRAVRPVDLPSASVPYATPSTVVVPEREARAHDGSCSGPRGWSSSAEARRPRPQRARSGAQAVSATLVREAPAHEARAGPAVAPGSSTAFVRPMRGPTTISSRLLRRAQRERRPVERQPVERTRDPERLAQPTRARAEQPYVVDPAPRAHRVEPRSRARARGSGSARDARRAADEVEAPVDPVGAIDVGMAGRAEHRRVPRRPSAEGVRSGSSGEYASTSTISPPTPSTSSSTPISSARPRSRRGRRSARARSEKRSGSGGRRLEQPPCATAEVETSRRPCSARRDAWARSSASSRIARSARSAHRPEDGALGARGDDRLRDALDPDPGARAVAALALGERLERVDLVGAHVLAEAEEDHAGRVGHGRLSRSGMLERLRSASTTRSASSTGSRAWNGIAIVRALASSLTGQSPSPKP